MGLVVLAHAGVPGLAGGFVGVDVFFVLSGYLITGLLVNERLTTGRIRYLEFLARRLRRLLPAMLTMLLIILLPLGFMPVITVSAALVVEVYGFSVQAYGLIFACAGLSILVGAATNRMLVSRFDMMQLLTLGVSLIAISGLALAGGMAQPRPGVVAGVVRDGVV